MNQPLNALLADLNSDPEGEGNLMDHSVDAMVTALRARFIRVYPCKRDFHNIHLTRKGRAEARKLGS